jgi:hypothetical protein
MAKKATRQVSIFLNGKEVTNTIKSISEEQRKLNNEIKNSVIGEEEYLQKVKDLQRVNGILADHRKGLSGIKDGYGLLKVGMGNLVGIAAGAFAVDAVLAYGKALFGTGVALDALTRKAKTVFAETLPFVRKEAEANARAMGLTTTQYVSAAASIQDLLIPMGFQRQEAAAISTNLVNLSGALSEWTGGQIDAKRVSEILSNALLGEREELKQLGISLQQADIDARLAEQGLKGLTGAARQQAEAAATLQLITERSTDAQAAFAAGAGSAVRSQAELAAKIAEIGEKLAVIFLPILAKIASGVGYVVDAIAGVVDAVGGLADPVTATTKAFDDQAAKVADLDKNIVPLLDRYDALAGQADLNKTEQDELQRIISTVSGVVPTAVTAFDQYGKALGINTQQARDFIEVEKQRLKFVNQEAIGAIEKEIVALEKKAKIEQDRLASRVRYDTPRFVGTGAGAAPVAVALTGAEIIEAQAALAGYQAQVSGARAELGRLKGDVLDTFKTIGETPPPSPPKVVSDTDRAKAKKEVESLQKELQDLLKSVGEFGQAQMLAQQNSELAIALDGVEKRYNAEIAKARELERKGVEDAVAQRVALEALKEVEIGRIAEAYHAKEVERERQREREKAQARYEEVVASEQFLAQREVERKAAEDQVAGVVNTALLSENEQIVLAVEEKYKKLLQLADDYGLSSTELLKAYEAEKLKATTESNQKIFAQQQELEQAQYQLQLARLDALGAGVSAFSSLFTEGSAIGKAAFLFEKALSAATVIINFQKERSAIWANANANPLNIAAPGASVAIATPQVTAARARMLQSLATIAATAIKEVATPKTKQKKEGGLVAVTGEDDGRTYQAKPIGMPRTGMLPSGPVLIHSRATGGPVLANERGAEYFVAAHDLRKPYVANLARMIDLATKGRVSQFADGGLNPASPALPSMPAMDMALLADLAKSIAALNAHLASGIQAVLGDATIVAAQQRFRKINEVSGGYYGS